MSLFVPAYTPSIQRGFAMSGYPPEANIGTALPPKADMDRSGCDVRFVPEADITLSELGAIFAGNFVQLLLASLYWRCAGSRSYFAEKIFQPGRCNGPEQN